MNQEIIELTPVLSVGVRAEAEALESMRREFGELEKSTSATEYWRTGNSLAPYEYEIALADLPRGSRILDVGVGFGQSSVYLADIGHKVVAVEPAMVLCRLIRDAAVRHGLDIVVVQGVGESLSRLGRNDFDAVVFNSSLHHCDDPILAIAEARRCLRPDGSIYLVNENWLKPWQSHAWYYRRLQEDPIGMGHYGGNEHAYHNGEYVKFLKTQFKLVELLSPRRGSALDDLRLLLNKHINGEWIYKRSGPVLARFIFYVLRERIRRFPRLYSILARMSVVPAHYRASRPIG